jgi:hypothetical protein
LNILFILNFAGYIVLLIALYLPQLRRIQPIVRGLLIAFTAVTILAWYLFAGLRLELDDVADKLIEIVLIVLLVIEGFQMRKPRIVNSEPTTPLASVRS